MKTVFEKLMADSLKEVIIIKKTLLGTTRRWPRPRPLNRGGRSMEVLSLIIYTKYFWDFDMWPFKRECPLNGGPLNRGSTVFSFPASYSAKKTCRELRKVNFCGNKNLPADRCPADRKLCRKIEF